MDEYIIINNNKFKKNKFKNSDRQNSIMNNKILSFSSGCVISLDDLDDFPDYLDIINKLYQSLKKPGSGNINEKILGTLLDADLEDVLHIPEFKDLMAEILQRFDLLFGGANKDNIRYKLIVFLLKLIKNFFTSFSIEQQQIGPYLKILKNYLPAQTPLLTDFLLSVSRFAPYVEKHKQFIDFYFAVVDETNIFKGDEQGIKFYIKAIDKILRFRVFRDLFFRTLEVEGTDKVLTNLPFFKYKLALYQNCQQKLDKIKELEYLVQFIKKNQIQSQFLNKYIQSQPNKGK